MVRKWSFWCGLLLEGTLHVSLCMDKHWQAQKFAAQKSAALVAASSKLPFCPSNSHCVTRGAGGSAVPLLGLI